VTISNVCFGRAKQGLDSLVESYQKLSAVEKDNLKQKPLSLSVVPLENA